MALEKDLIKCGCGARYDKDVQWCIGYYPKGSTSEDYILVSRLEKGKCPICRKPAETTK